MVAIFKKPDINNSDKHHRNVIMILKMSIFFNSSNCTTDVIANISS